MIIFNERILGRLPTRTYPMRPNNNAVVVAVTKHAIPSSHISAAS